MTTLRRLPLGLCFLLSSACVAGAGASSTPPPYTPPPAQPAPPVAPTPAAAPEFPRTGGDSIATAESFAIGAMVEGVVDPNTEVFYTFDAVAGQKLLLTIYSEIALDRGRASGGVNMTVNLLDSYGGQLASKKPATYAHSGTSDFDKAELKYTPKTSGPIALQMTCAGCKFGVHYKVVTVVAP